ncbi:glycosyltransferase family 2 protein [Curtobacterium poinsettiae]|uniref:glycosyltransferase family 2 protein n=1 Tax=Curtobacterium poinsettiae TaxID=159612 RepID=UPI0021C90C74|nr:glycosyltransferase family 2 protein [Curtobacterium flaccumfaciens]MCU0114013.1 glycosyltransferase family 2 protein [Curtobacterium flaccumfaciens]
MPVRTVRPADPRVSVVIPARNEARNLEIILPKLPPVYEVILVDGNSVDDTIATAQRVMPGIRVVHQTRKGKGNALACGFEAVTGDVVVMFDADCSADPDEIPRFVQALVEGADVAKGTRYSLGGGSDDITIVRNMGNRGLNLLCNVILGTRYSDLCYGYNAFWRPTCCRRSVCCRPSCRSRPTARCCGATGSRSRPSSPAAGRPPNSRSPRCRATRSSACTVPAT